METDKKITGLVLAGGRGTRMGSVDKGLQAFGDMPMVSHVIARLRPQVDVLHVNANQNIETYRALGYPVWEDAVDGFAGPLAGLHSGLLHCTTPWLITAPCDSPYLPLDLVARLQSAQIASNADIAVPFTTENGTKQAHPVFCLLRSTLLPHLSTFLESGGRKVDTWYSSLSVTEVDFADGPAFRNINTMAELRASMPEDRSAS